MANSIITKGALLTLVESANLALEGHSVFLIEAGGDMSDSILEQLALL